MAEIIKRAKALAVNPLKASQPVGAALAFLGLKNAVPMLHGSQGCTAFGKVFFVRHFREPIPLQTTAMDQISTVMNADENVIEGLKALCEKNSPEIIGLPTTSLSEAQGSDIRRLVRQFRDAYPQYAGTAIVPVNTPDFSGCLETGFALALEAIIYVLVPETRHAGRQHQQVNVLASSMLTPGDIESIKEWIESFGLRPVVLPDIGDSLDGHLVDSDYSPLTLGGTPRRAIESMGESVATLVIGRSLGRAADLLKARTGVPDFRFDHLLGLDASDHFTQTLAEISAQPVAQKLERQRAQLQDALVDTHFMLGFTRVALALDPDLLLGFSAFFAALGADVVAAVSPVRAAALADLHCATVQIGDLEDLERAAKKTDAQLLVGSSHAAQVAGRLGIPLLRAGFPQYDWVGGYARAWVGYRNARQTLFDIANQILGQHHDIPAYRSIFRSEPERAQDRAGLVSH